MTIIRDLAHVDETGFAISQWIDGRREVSIDSYPRRERAGDIRAGLLEVHDYPVPAYYQDHPDLRPVRLSDLAPFPQFRDTATYARVFEPMNLRYHIVVPVRLSQAGRMTDYSLNRSDCDFTDADLQLACGLQTTLSAIHAAAHVPDVIPDYSAGPAGARLTARERDILQLLAAGMTAVAIGHARRVSPRTVHKHLENLYTKLGVHDRLLAVDRARRLGVLPPSSTETGLR